MDITINDQNAAELLDGDFPHKVQVTEEMGSDGEKVILFVEIRNQNIRIDVQKWDDDGTMTSAKGKNISFRELIDDLG